ITLAYQRLQTVDLPAGDKPTAGRQGVADLFVDHLVRQTEFWNLAAHHSAGARVGIEHVNLVADRRQVSGDRQRRRPRSDAAHAFAVAPARRLRQQCRNILLVVGGDAFEPTDRYRLFPKPSSATRWLAR